MTSMFHWLDVNRQPLRHFATKTFQLRDKFRRKFPARLLTDFYKLSSVYKNCEKEKRRKEKKKKRRKKERAINCSLFASNAFITFGSLVYHWTKRGGGKGRGVRKKKKERKIKREGPSEERRLKDGRLFRATRKLKSPPCRFLGDEMNFITDILQTGSPEKGTTKLKGINFFGCNWLPFSLSLSLFHIHTHTISLSSSLRTRFVFGERERVPH